MTGYWTDLKTQRLSRRRTLAAAGAAGMGALLLAACGGGKEKVHEDASSLVAKPEETTAKAVPGGIWQDQLDGDILHLDVNLNAAVHACRAFLPRMVERRTRSLLA
mgnify:CR=1 FL=1